MNLRFYIDPETGQPHLHRHAVSEQEAEDVLARPLEDRPGREGARVVIGRTRGGRYLRVIYVPDPEPDSAFVITAFDVGAKPLRALRRRRKEQAMTPSRYPPGWDEARVRGVLEHYESQSPDEAVAEDEATYESTTHTAMEVPVELVPKVRELIARRRVS